MKRRIVSLIFIAAVMFSLCSLSVSAKDDKVLQCTFSNDKATMEVFMSEYMDNDTNVMIGNEYFPVEVVNDVDMKTIFLVDKSTSMPKMVTEGLESMVSRYMSEMPANESISIIAFDSEIHHITDNYINSTEDLKTAVSKIKFDGNESYIYDCIIDTIDTLYTDDNSYYKIILMSDGWDRSERYTFEELKNKIDKNCRYHIDILQTTNYNQRNEKLSSIGSLSSNTYTFYRSEEDISTLVEKEVCLLNVELNEKVTTGEYKGVTVKSSKGDVVLGSVLFSQIDWNSPELADRRTPTESSLNIFLWIAGGIVLVAAIVAAFILSRLLKRKECEIFVNIKKDAETDKYKTGDFIWKFNSNQEFRVGRVDEPVDNDGNPLPKNHFSIYEENNEISIGRNAFVIKYAPLKKNFIIKNISNVAVFSIDVESKVIEKGDTYNLIPGTRILLGKYTSINIINMTVK